MEMKSSTGFRFAIDRGGTFTDIIAQIPVEPGYRLLKLLSVDPDNYDDAPTEGIRRILNETLNLNIERGQPIPTAQIEWIRMGTTLATNALIERQGEPLILLTTRGFRDLLQIGTQARPHIFDLEIRKPELLYQAVLEIDERVRLCKHEPTDEDIRSGKVVRGVTGEWIEILRAPNLSKIRTQLQALLDYSSKKISIIRSCAIVFMHAFTFFKHEELVGKLCEEMGFECVSLSHQLTPMIKIVQRGHTATVDAYLTPLIRSYIEKFSRGFDTNISKVNISFMMSDGGLCPMDKFHGFRSILSGPAGGVVGYAKTGYHSDLDDNNQEVVKKGCTEKVAMIGLDMGGTSTDVSRYDGEYEHIFESKITDVFIQAPQLAIQTIAAGGGSLLTFESGLFMVGPKSSGAHPGPLCYRKNGKLSLTDANVVLGRIIPEHFAHIFGPNEDQPISVELSLDAFEKLTQEINTFYLDQDQRGRAVISSGSDGTNISLLEEKKELNVDQVAYGFIQVANEAMCRPIRNITEAKGFDVSQHTLTVFGGAGPQHACAIARNLGIRKIFIHRYCSILSAYGIGLADVIYEKQQAINQIYSNEALSSVIALKLEKLIQECMSKIDHDFCGNDKQAYSERHWEIHTYLNLRYQGTDTSIMIETPKQDSRDDYQSLFENQYKREFGFNLPSRTIYIDSLRTRVIIKQPEILKDSFIKGDGHASISQNRTVTLPNPLYTKSIYFENGRLETPIYPLDNLLLGNCIPGPAVIIDDTTSTIVEPGCEARIRQDGNIEIIVNFNSSVIGEKNASPLQEVKLNMIQLSLFSNRFMSIAEQMGHVIERTAVSTNIKERLDFSCALFGPDGSLVSNAPHLPVHLGSMQEAVRWQVNYWKGDLKSGEVIASNHPQAGGSHLPDITVITPVFDPESSDKEPIFFVACRGHHADIGGISPGSMPPFSTHLSDEGAAFKSIKIVEDGQFQESKMTEILLAPGRIPRQPWELPCSGTRNLVDNILDLQAQISANSKGIQLVHQLIAKYGLKVVHAYMKFIQQTAEQAVRNMLVKLSLQLQLPPIGSFITEDFMDNGSRIRLHLTIDRENASATFDFTGTDPQVYGNINAPRSVTCSAIIYSLRCMIDQQELPLNSGFLLPITITIPKNSLLDPSKYLGVVGGNVLTSQRITDLVLTAFGAVANSQGCMNNFTFGNEKLGYYETICGGAGAGPTWHGRDAVQVHMTNTRITDAEILERLYPIMLHQFSIRANSGGKGKYCGGNGVIREFEFLEPLQVGILSERRTLAPRGLAGGGDGSRGRNIFIPKPSLEDDVGEIFLGGKCSIRVNPGDRIRIETPGGGAYGSPPSPTTASYT